jgi:hypothetical protein
MGESVHGRRNGDGPGDEEATEAERTLQAWVRDVVEVSEVVAGWPIPDGAQFAAMARKAVLDALESVAEGAGDPLETLLMAIGPIVAGVGLLEVRMAEAERRLAELARSRGDS